MDVRPVYMGFCCSTRIALTMPNYNVAENQTPKVFILGASLFLADVNSSGKLLTGSGVGNATPHTQGPKLMIMGPSGYVADVSSTANLSTTNG